MSKLKKYRVTADWFSDAEVTLLVDHDKLTPALATEINKFVSDADYRLAAEDDDVVRAVIRMFGSDAIGYFMGDGGASFGPRADGDRYSTEAVLKHLYEGWPPCDELGILIVAAEVSAVGYDDVTLEAVQEGGAA